MTEDSKKTASKKAAPKKKTTTKADNKPTEDQSEDIIFTLVDPDEKTPHVLTAINQVQADISIIGIKKAQQHEDEFYLFRGIDDIYNSISKLLAKYGLITMPNVKSRTINEREKISGYVVFHTHLEVEYKLISAKDGSQYETTVIGEAMTHDHKGTLTAMSNAYKALCFQLFCIPVEGENEHEEASHSGIKPDATAQQSHPTSETDLSVSQNNKPNPPPVDVITVQQCQEYINGCNNHNDLDLVYSRAKSSKIDKQMLTAFRKKREHLNKTIGEKPSQTIIKTNEPQRT